MSSFAVLDYESDSSVDMDEEISESDFEIVTPRSSPKRKPMPMPHVSKGMEYYFWLNPEDNVLFPTEKERENSKKPPTMVFPGPGVSWADFQENLEQTPGTEEWALEQERQQKLQKEEEKNRIKRIERMKHMEFERKKRLEENKRIDSLSIKLAGELYSSTSAVVEQRDEIAKRNKIPFRESNQTYIVLPQKDQDFLWDLIEYHPKAAEKKQVIKSFVYGKVEERKFSGLLVLQHDGKIDSFSQQKAFKRIEEIFIRRGLGEPNIMKKKKSFQKNHNNFNYNYNNNKWSNRFY